MRILWLCNIILPDVAAELGIPASNKEGWLSGICGAVAGEHDFELHICFPMDSAHDGFRLQKNGISYYGFFEDTGHPEVYDAALEDRLKEICRQVKPDVVHIFGTEYPHTLAMCRVMKNEASKILIGIQGVMCECVKAYMADIPTHVIKRNTFRDILRKDGLKIQYNKFAQRAKYEAEAVSIAGNLTGRTPFDRAFHDKYSPQSKYYFMNETLRSVFYEGSWDAEEMEEHSVFLSQVNYPLKGGHYFFEAMPAIIEKYPDTKVYISGDNITKHASLIEKIKLSSYGKYLLELIKKNKLEGRIVFLGNISGEAVKQNLIKANVFACTSSVENSPNSLGEAMLLGVPCIAADVGGISGIFNAEEDGIMYKAKNKTEAIKGIADAVIRMFDDPEYAKLAGKRASAHARVTHDPSINYQRLIEIYTDIAKG